MLPPSDLRRRWRRPSSRPPFLHQVPPVPRHARPVTFRVPVRGRFGPPHASCVAGPPVASASAPILRLVGAVSCASPAVLAFHTILSAGCPCFCKGRASRDAWSGILYGRNDSVLCLNRVRVPGAGLGVRPWSARYATRGPAISGPAYGRPLWYRADEQAQATAVVARPRRSTGEKKACTLRRKAKQAPGWNVREPDSPPPKAAPLPPNHSPSNRSHSPIPPMPWLAAAAAATADLSRQAPAGEGDGANLARRPRLATQPTPAHRQGKLTPP
jgi:hypothetical protein